MSLLSSNNFYYHRDRLGNVTEITNFLGDVVQRYVYDSFGGITIYDSEGDEITTDSEGYLENPFTYTGREYDPETGLYYYRARYYNPETGRFLSEDPIEFSGGDTNLYRYIVNNPINLTDPYGLLVKRCNRPLKFLPPDLFYPSLGVSHSFLCVNGVCSGQPSPGEDPGESEEGASCEVVPPPEGKDEEQSQRRSECFDMCVERILEGPRPLYTPLSTCHHYATNTLYMCNIQCRFLP